MELEERHVGQVWLKMGGLGMGGALFRVSQHPHLADEETEEENVRLSYTCTSDYTDALRAVWAQRSMGSSTEPVHVPSKGTEHNAPGVIQVLTS